MKKGVKGLEFASFWPAATLYAGGKNDYQRLGEGGGGG